MKHQDALAELLTREQGKPLAEAKGEVGMSAAYVLWFAEEARRVYGDVIPSPWADRRIIVTKQPLGVVGAITPWNYPISMLTRKLGPAMAAGTELASFHPLVAFADPDAAVEALHGATIAIEGDAPLVRLLGELAEACGAQPVRLPVEGKAAYHAAAVLSAGGFVALLDAIAELGRGAGLDEAGSLAIYAPLIRQSLANAERFGIDTALTGPIVRGDIGTLRAHLGAMAALAPGATGLYVAAARREILLAVARGSLGADPAAEMSSLLERAENGTDA